MKAGLKTQKSRSTHRQRGFGLIEALVAIVVMAFGLLAVVGVQLEALRGNQQASQSAVAASLVRDYQEMMVAMPSSQLSASSSTVSITKNAYTPLGTAVECKGTSASCTSAQFNDFQITDWLARVASALPGGVATVCLDNDYKESSGLYKWDCSGTGDVMVIKIGWTAKVGRTSDGTVRETGINDGTDRPRLVIPIAGNQAGYRL